MANTASAWIINGWSQDHSRAGWSVGGVRPGSVLDQICAVFAAMFVHVRGLPMFSTLLGFGFGLVAASLARKGYTTQEARRVLIRRYGILALFGLVHLLLLFFGDIMVTYGFVGIVLALVFTWPPKRLRIVAHTVLALYAAFATLGAAAALFVDGDFGGIQLTPTAEHTTPGNYLGANLSVGFSVLFSQPFAVLQISALAAIGYLWASERVLIDVSSHRKTLSTWVWIAGAIIVLVGLPWGLCAAGVLPGEWELPLYALNEALGLYTGPGILAALALATDSLHNEVPAWAKAFVALGKRSMSGYIAQSFIFIALVMPFTLGLGSDASVAGKIGLGALVWLTTLLLAVVLEKAGTQGPFEWAHRRLSYGATGRIEPKELQQHDRAQIAG